MNSKYSTSHLKLSILTLCILTAFSSQAGEVSSTYSDGDTLTANHMTEIADAVNDNNARIRNFFGGDGSDGDLTVDSDIDWGGTPPTDIYFDNITIDAGQTFHVPAGTTIRCFGDFTNNGTIRVNQGTRSSGAFSGLSGYSAPTDMMTSVAHPGDSLSVAALGSSHNDSTGNPVSLFGGPGGTGIPQAMAITSFDKFRIGGGSGAGYSPQGNSGGGLLKVYCNGAIVNAGTINAVGLGGRNDSIAGGGGGIVILASRTSVDNFDGTIDVSGGDGENATGSFGGNGGGGGGGIVIMISPTAPVIGTETVAGGLGGTSTTDLSAASRTAGGGGGASGGNGGQGGPVNSSGTRSAAADGSDGYVITLTKDPAMLAR